MKLWVTVTLASLVTSCIYCAAPKLDPFQQELKKRVQTKPPQAPAPKAAHKQQAPKPTTSVQQEIKKQAEPKKIVTAPAKPTPVKPVTTPPQVPAVKWSEREKKQSPEERQKKTEACLDELRKKYKAELEQEEQELMQIFFELTGLTPEAWETLYAKERPEIIKEGKQYAKDYINAEPLPKHSKYFILTQKMLEKNNIDPDSIEILANYTMDWNMTTLPRAIIINPLESKRYPSDTALEAWLLHEIQHIVFQDNIHYALIGEQLTGKVEQTSFIQLYNFFREKRADILAGLTSDIHMKALINDLEETPEAMKFAEDPHHQHAAQRAATLRPIYQEMLACYKQ